MIKPENIQPFIEGAKSLADVTVGVTTELIAEAINLYILLGVLAIIKFAAVFVVFFIVRKYLSNLPEEYKKAKDIGITISLCSSILFFTVNSFPHLEEMVKAMVAPKIFLLEKGTELIKRK